MFYLSNRYTCITSSLHPSSRLTPSVSPFYFHSLNITPPFCLPSFPSFSLSCNPAFLTQWGQQNQKCEASVSLPLRPSLSLSFPAFHLSAHCCSCQPTMGAEKGQTTFFFFFFWKVFWKGLLESVSRGPLSASYHRTTLALVTACRSLPNMQHNLSSFPRSLSLSLILFLLPLSISCPEGIFASFNLSVISQVLPPLRLSPAVPPVFPVFLPLHFYFTHSLACPGCFFVFFSVFSLCLFTHPSFSLLLSSSVLFCHPSFSWLALHRHRSGDQTNSSADLHKK